MVGCGYISRKWHIPGFQRLKNAEVVAVCDVSSALAQSTAKDFGIPKNYADMGQMLADENLDVVDICTPPGTHAPLTIQALEADCNVLLEKPMALKLVDCDEMVRVSKKQSKKICVIHNELFRPPLLKAKKLVQEGSIGKVIGLQWTRLTNTEEYLAKENHWVHKLPGGCLGETGPHGVYTSLAFLKKVDSVDITAKKNSSYPWSKFDTFNITLDGEKAFSSIIISHASHNYVADLNILGTEGALRIDLQTMILTKFQLSDVKAMSLAKVGLKRAGQITSCVFLNGSKMLISKNSVLMKATGHGNEIEAFVQSIINNTESPVTGEEGREVIRVMEMLVKRLNEKYSDGAATTKLSSPVKPPVLTLIH
jgi:2-alkyl-3-oxoalkanoate reductase